MPKSLKDPAPAGDDAESDTEPGVLFVTPEADVAEPELPLGLEPEPAPQPLGPIGRAKILVGTASWTDPGLIKCGRFYPKGCSSAEARLRYYASRFPMVEVNSSYYVLPTRSNSELWAERTPPGFNFNVKAFRLSPATRRRSTHCRWASRHHSARTRRRTSTTRTCPRSWST